MMRRSDVVRASSRLTVAAAITLSGCGFHGLYGTHLPGGADLGGHPYSVTIYFTNVLDLVPQSAVKVNDVAVGRVETVDAEQQERQLRRPEANGWTAKVDVKVNGDVHLPANARAEVKQTSLLGEKYVALEQPLDDAGRDATLKNGDTIPITRTGSAPEVEEVLGALSLLLNGGGLQQIHIITTELNKALQGNEAAVRDLLGQLNTFVGTLDQQKSRSSPRWTASTGWRARSTTTSRRSSPRWTPSRRRSRSCKDERTKLSRCSPACRTSARWPPGVINATQTEPRRRAEVAAPALEQLTAAGSNLPRR